MKKLILFVFVVTAMGAALFWVSQHIATAEPSEQSGLSASTVSATNLTNYLETIDTANFSQNQKELLQVLQTEYAKEPKSYDDTVMTYTEGFEESWCADFISWVYNEIDEPFVHPDTGYWRIPGVQTLLTYYSGYDLYHGVSSDYQPQFGDVAFYFGETPDGSSTEHVAIVLAVENGVIYTIGGNEGDGILQIRANTYTANEKGLMAIGESGL